MSKRLFVGGLPWAVTDEDLKQLFSQFGDVTYAKVIIDRDSGRSKGFGFVEIPDDKVAEALKLNDTEYQGRKIVVNEARPMEERSNDRSYGSNKQW